MRAIFKKDFMSAFHSFIGWLFIAIYWFFFSVYVSYYNFNGHYADLSTAVSVMQMILTILIPILCMRSFADERRQKTDQLLFTAPVSIGQIVAGKFFALAAIYSIPCAAACIVPPILSKYGDVSYPASYIAIFGMWFFGMACIAICIFASSLTENIVIAAVLSFAMLFVTYIIPGLEQVTSSSGTALGKFLEALSFRDRFDAFTGGTFSVTGTIYFLSVILLFLFLTTQVIQKRRYSVSKKTFSFGAYSTAMIVISIAAAVVVNLAVNQLPESVKTIDATTDKLYTLTDDTKNLVSTLDEDVTIYILTNSGNEDDTLEKTLAGYEDLSDHLKVEHVDPSEDPTFIKKYASDTSELYMNSMVVVSDKRYKIINASDLYGYSYTSDYSSYQIDSYDGEGQITAAIDYVTSDNMPTVYTLTGHGETDLATTFTDTLAKMNINVASLDLMQNDTVPDDAQAVIINAPTSDLSEDDLNKLEAYADQGGNLIMVTNYTAGQTLTNYDSLLGYYQIGVEDGVVLEDDTGRYYQYQAYLLPVIAQDDVTADITNNYVMSAFSQSLTIPDSEVDGYTITPLLTTSENAYIHTDVQDEAALERTDSESTGTYNVGVKSVKTNEDGSTSTAIVYSSQFIFDEQANAMVSGSNNSLFKGSVAAVTDSQDAVSIDAKTISNNYLTISAGTASRLTIIFTGIIPVVLIVLGIVIWVRRRHQ